MRIGMMVDIYKPHVSGITNFIALNKRYLERIGHEVYIFTFGDLEYADDEPRVIRSPGLPLVDTGYYLNFRYSQKAKALLQTMDLVHVHHPFLSGRLALRYCRPLRIPIVFTNHTRYDLYAQAYLPMLPEELSDTLLHSYLPPFCDAVELVVSPSSGMVEVLRKQGVTCPIEVVPNGVELERFQVTCQGEDCRKEFGFSKEDILLIYVGRLGPEKNIDFLINSFSGVAEAIENVHLLLVGGGPEDEDLHHQASQTIASGRIHFIGMVNYERLPEYLAMCDAFVTASVTEVHPLSVIEAMASGLPVLGIHSVGVGDTVDDGITGFLASEDPAAFAAKMTRLCLDRDLRLRMGAASRKAADKFAIERTTQLMSTLYQRSVERASARKRGIDLFLHRLIEKFRK